MTPGEIAALPIPKIAEDNAFLWLWVTNSRSKSSGRPIIQQGFDLLEHWGFRYNTTVTWSKGTGPCPFGPYQITTEHILFAYRGKFEIPKKSMGKMKTIFLTDPARHSEKPAVFYENVRNNFEGPRVDLFARRRHEGFYAWGNQVEDEVQENLI